MLTTKGHTHHAMRGRSAIRNQEQQDRSHRDARRFSTRKAARLTSLRWTTCIGTSLAPRVALRSGCGVLAAPPAQTEADFLPSQPVFRYTVDSDDHARRTRDRPARRAPRRQFFNPPLKSRLTSPLLRKQQCHCFKGASNYEDSSSS